VGEVMTAMDIYDDDSDDEGDPPWCCTTRVSLAILAFFGFMSVASQSAAMDVGFVCMLNQTGAPPDILSDETHDGIECGPHPWLFPANLTLVPKVGR